MGLAVAVAVAVAVVGDVSAVDPVWVGACWTANATSSVSPAGLGPRRNAAGWRRAAAPESRRRSRRTPLVPRHDRRCPATKKVERLAPGRQVPASARSPSPRRATHSLHHRHTSRFGQSQRTRRSSCRDHAHDRPRQTPRGGRPGRGHAGSGGRAPAHRRKTRAGHAAARGDVRRRRPGDHRRVAVRRRRDHRDRRGQGARWGGARRVRHPGQPRPLDPSDDHRAHRDHRRPWSSPRRASPRCCPAFLEFARGSVLVAHNARFDVGFLKANAARMDLAWPRPTVVDTVMLARRVVTKDEAPNHRLASLARLFGAATTPNHRALQDARATVDVLHGLLARMASLGVSSPRGSRHCSPIRSLPPNGGAPLSPITLPRSPGVYQFIDGRGRRSCTSARATDLRRPGSAVLHGVGDPTAGSARWSASRSR